jgi:hypothetical protein
MARGERRSNGGPPVYEPGAKKQECLTHGQASIANVAAFNDRSVTTSKLRSVHTASTSS